MKLQVNPQASYVKQFSAVIGFSNKGTSICQLYFTRVVESNKIYLRFVPLFVSYCHPPWPGKKQGHEEAAKLWEFTAN